MRGTPEELGVQLEELYVKLDLGTALGSAALADSTHPHPLVIAAGDRRVTQADAMAEFAAQFPYDAPDAPQQMYEHKFLHGVLMLGAALDEGFQAEVAAAVAPFGVLPEDHSLQPAPPKGFARAIGKLASDYRYEEKPRSAFNCDVIRVLVACSLDKTAALVGALDAAFGGTVKLKNLYELIEAEREGRFGITPIMLTLVYEPGCTVGEAMRRGKAAVDAYCGKACGQPRERWHRHTDEVRELLEASTAPARILCEVQILLAEMVEVRHKMHEGYKVFRADAPHLLFEDFKVSSGGVEVDGRSVWQASARGQCDVVAKLLDGGGDVDDANADGATALFCAAQNGHPDMVHLLLERGADVDRARRSDGSFPLFKACHNGHLDVV